MTEKLNSSKQPMRKSDRYLIAAFSAAALVCAGVGSFLTLSPEYVSKKIEEFRSPDKNVLVLYRLNKQDIQKNLSTVPWEDGERHSVVMAVKGKDGETHGMTVSWQDMWLEDHPNIPNRCRGLTLSLGERHAVTSYCEYDGDKPRSLGALPTHFAPNRNSRAAAHAL